MQQDYKKTRTNQELKKILRKVQKEYIILEKKLSNKNVLVDIFGSEKKYITATSALNIPYNDIQCDWHQIDMLSSGNYHIHPVNYTGAYDIFKDYGIYDNTEFFSSRGYKVTNVFVATPIRAILDILYLNIAIRKKYPKHFMMRDYLFEEINVEELKEKLDILENNLNVDSKEILINWRKDNDLGT